MATARRSAEHGKSSARVCARGPEPVACRDSTRRWCCRGGVGVTAQCLRAGPSRLHPSPPVAGSQCRLQDHTRSREAHRHRRVPTTLSHPVCGCAHLPLRRRAETMACGEIIGEIYGARPLEKYGTGCLGSGDRAHAHCAAVLSRFLC